MRCHRAWEFVSNQLFASGALERWGETPSSPDLQTTGISSREAARPPGFIVGNGHGYKRISVTPD